MGSGITILRISWEELGRRVGFSPILNFGVVLHLGRQAVFYPCRNSILVPGIPLGDPPLAEFRANFLLLLEFFFEFRYSDGSAYMFFLGRR